MSSRPIVLVHGAWGGAWIWRRVLAPLRAAGHEVHAVTLTGDGERAHQRTPDIGVATHAADVCALIEAEELSDLLLVGHSYGGMVITAASDALLQRQPGAVTGLVYVDAVVPLPGEAWGSLHTPEVQAQRRALAAQHGNGLPPPDPEVFGLRGADRDWLLRRSVPHPFAGYGETVPFDGARWAALPRTYIDCTAPAYPTIAPYRLRVREQAGWTLHELATGHCPMVSEPQALVALLLQAAAR